MKKDMKHCSDTGKMKQKLYHTNQKRLFWKNYVFEEEEALIGIACFLMMIWFIRSFSLLCKNT